MTEETLSITKGPGYDWSVKYLDADDPEVRILNVFGVLTIEDALAEARYSLGTSFFKPKEVYTNYQIVGIDRI